MTEHILELQKRNITDWIQLENIADTVEHQSVSTIFKNLAVNSLWTKLDAKTITLEKFIKDAGKLIGPVFEKLQCKI